MLETARVLGKRTHLDQQCQRSRKVLKFVTTFLSAEQLTVAKRLNESDPDLGGRKRSFGVFVHYADCLKLDFQVLHPVVKVSLIHLSTGKPLPKSDKRKHVTSYYEGTAASVVASG